LGEVTRVPVLLRRRIELKEHEHTDHPVSNTSNQIRLKTGNESFWAYQYPDLPKNQAEVNNHLLTDKYAYGDRVEFDEDRNVVRLVKTREEIKKELEAKND